MHNQVRDPLLQLFNQMIVFQTPHFLQKLSSNSAFRSSRPNFICWKQREDLWLTLMCWECWRWGRMCTWRQLLSVCALCVWRIWASSMSARLLWPEFAFMQEKKLPRHAIAWPGKCHPLPEKNQPSTKLEWMTNETNLAKVAGEASETL